MNQRELKQEIKDRKLRNLYIFCSDDYFLKKLYRKRIEESGDFDFEVMDIESDDGLKKISEHTNSKTLFGSSKRRIIYARIHYVISNADVENRSNNVVILDPAGCKNLKHKNLIKFEKPTEDEIRKFIIYKVAQEGKKIEQRGVDFILGKFAKQDTASLNMFMEKVLLYNMGEDLIRYEDIEKIEDFGQNLNVFKLSEYIMQNNSKKFFKEIDDILGFVHPSVIVSILTNETIKTILSSTFQDDELRNLEINRFSSTKYRHYLKTLGKRKIVDLINILYDMDLIIKSLSLNGFNELFKARMFEWFNY